MDLEPVLNVMMLSWRVVGRNLEGDRHAVSNIPFQHYAFKDEAKAALVKDSVRTAQ